MQKKLYLPGLLMVLVLAGCQKDIQQLKEEENLSLISMAKGPGAPTGNGTIYLKVTVSEATGNMINSDGYGELIYTHGIDRVEAQILSSDGNFYMNTNNNTVKPRIRFLYFPPNITVYQKEMNGKRNYSLRTSAPLAAVNGGTTYWLQNMPVTNPAFSQYMSFRVWGVDQGGVVDWRLVYRNGPENTSSSLTDYAKVTRVNNDVWTIEPANYPGVTASNAALYNGDASIRLGDHVVPFKLTLTRYVR